MINHSKNMMERSFRVSEFFKDGDVIIGMGKEETPEYITLLETGRFVFFVNKKSESVQDFLMRMSSNNKLGNNVYVALRVPQRCISIQSEVEQVIDFKNKQKKCYWSVVQDIYGENEIQIAILTDKPM